MAAGGDHLDKKQQEVDCTKDWHHGEIASNLMGLQCANHPELIFLCVFDSLFHIVAEYFCKALLSWALLLNLLLG